MQPASIGQAPPAATTASKAKSADPSQWQAALAQAQAPAAPQAGDTADKKTPAAAKPGPEQAAQDKAAPVVRAAVVTKALLHPRKPAAAGTAENATPPALHEDKGAAAPASAVALPVIPAAMGSPPAAAQVLARTMGKAASTPLPQATRLAAIGTYSGPPPTLACSPSAPPADGGAPAVPLHAAPSAPRSPTAGSGGVPQPAAPGAVLAAVASPSAAPVPGVPSCPATAQPSATTHAAAPALPAGAALAATAAGAKAGLAAARGEAMPAGVLKPVNTTNDAPAGKPAPAVLSLTAAAASAHDTTAPPQPVAEAATPPPSVQPSATALAATVTAMHQSGQGGAVLRLDPPGLGNLAVHVALDAGGQINVLFLPSTAAATTALQINLPGLGPALAQAGLTLGQAQVGGQFNQNAGQSGYQPPANTAPGAAPTRAAPEPPPQTGVSAYA